jgi:hypothetical protein
VSFGTFLILGIVIGIVPILVVWACCGGFRSQKRDEPSAGSGRVRRSAGNALLVLDGFFEPKVEHVLTARQQVSHDDEEPGGDDGEPSEESILEDLHEALSAPHIDPDDVRRHLAYAQRSGHDWRPLYQQAVQRLLQAQPYRAPAIPPEARVAPRE